MLCLVGIGLTPKHLTLEAIDTLKECKRVYIESYTSSYAEGTVSELELRLNKKISALKRKEVEEGIRELLIEAKKENIALVVFGNPLTATTHVQIILDAKKAGVKTKVVAGISVTNYLAKTGLDEYRFGRTCTVVAPKENFSPESFYGVIEKNLNAGLHTLCLLEITEEGKLMSIREAIEVLEGIQKKKKNKAIDRALLVALSAAGSSKEEIVAGKAEKLKKHKFNGMPQSLIVCGKLNEKEREAIGELNE